MSKILETKLTYTTERGTTLRVPATLEFVDGRILFLKSPFALKDEIKAMKGSRWHGHLEGDGRKMWSVDDCFRNRFQLGFLMGQDVYGWFDRPLVRHEYREYKRNGKPTSPMPHQFDLADAGLTYHYQIWGAEMGCIDGDAVVHAHRAGRGFQIKLAELHKKWSEQRNHGGRLGQLGWDPSIPTYVRSLCGNTLGLHQLRNVLDQGVKEVVRVTLSNGSTIRVTPDHEFFDANLSLVRADSLTRGSRIIVSGHVDFMPALGEVASVTGDGAAHVYDLVMADPYRNFVANGFVVKNCGKTLSAQMVIEQSKVCPWYWVGPKSSLPNIQREFRMWGFDSSVADIEYMTYERLARVMDEWKPGDLIPGGVIFDESSRLKTCTSQRSKAAAKLADLIRAKHGSNGYVILMSGTPSPKRPTDWHSQCEITWPGFLREGSVKALEQRMAFQVQKTFDSGTFWQTVGWKDDERKCAICGEFAEAACHQDEYEDDYHPFKASKNEVAYLFERLKGLVVIKHKKDCLSLPDKRYRRVVCKPTSSVLRVAKTIVDAAANAVTGMTLLRELSDGFQYREVEDGTRVCPLCKGTKEVDEWLNPDGKAYQSIEMLPEELVATLEKHTVECPRCHGAGEVTKTKRVAREVPCPKEQALRNLLDENEETGRMVVFAGFTGSVDRVVGICRAEGWDVVRCDGRGFQVTKANGETVTDVQPLDYWADLENLRVAFVAHPESGGMSLTLTEARMAVYWSNSFKPEYRIQSEDRIHRKGMDENLGCTIVDLIHLPTDERVLEVIRENRKLELMTMGEITQDIDWDDAAEDGVMEVHDT